MAKVDAPVGDKTAPPGTVDRANWARLQMQSLVTDLPKTPERFAGWWKEIGAKYPDPQKPTKTVFGWQLLNDDTGARFKTLDAFCEFRSPWGLGKPRVEIVAFLKAAKAVPPRTIGGHKIEVDAERALARAGAVDGRKSNGANQHTGTVVDSPHHGGNPQTRAEGHEAERLRAISRAPAPLPDLFDAGLVSKAVAVAASGAGPEVGAAAEAVIAEHGAPKDAAAARVTRKAVDAAVKPQLDLTPQHPSEAAVKDAILSWSDDKRTSLRKWLDTLISGA